MKKKMKKWFSCIIAATMVMSTVNLPTNILASDFDDGVEISVEDENEDAPEVVVNGEEGSDFSDEEVAVIEDSDVTDEVADDISSENGDEQLFSDHVDEDIDAVVDDGDSDSVGITQSEFDSKLNELRKQYPNYSVWNDSFDGGTQCFGFARLMGYKVFGTKPSTWGRVNSISDVKAGDLVQYGNTSGSGHTIFVTNVSGDTITFVDCNGNGNYSGGNKVRSNGIKWDNTIKKGAKIWSKYSFSYLLSSPGVSSNPEPVSNSPFGFLDTVTAEEGRITVSGWAADMDEPNQPIEVHVYAVQNGERVGLGPTTANLERPDICNNYPGINAYHGFCATFITNLSGDVGVEAYGINVGSTGGNSMLDGAPMTVSVPKDTTPPSISNIEIVDLSVSGYTVTCDVSDNVAISKVQFPTWTENGGQDDLIWHQGTVSGNKASCRIEVSDHNNETNCVYVTHIYVDDLAGNSAFGSIGAYPENEPPVISNVDITDLSASGFTVNCDVTDNSEIAKVQFAVWTENNGHDDLIWHQGTVTGNKASCRINVSEHNNETDCVYIVHIYADDISGNRGGYPISAYVDATGPVISDVEITDITEKGYTVKCSVEDDHSGISRVQFPTWFADQNPYISDGSWKTDPAVRGRLEDGKYIYRVNTSDFDDQIGSYNTHIYAWDNCGNQSENHPVQVTIKKIHNHEYISSIKKAPTCTETGIKLFICKDGDDSYEQEIPATGHIWDSGKITKQATCTTDGQKIYTCTSCKKTKTESITKNGHKEVKDVAVAATCESTGKTEGSHCSICNTIIKKQETIPATGHAWDNGKVTKQASCTTDGQKTYTCTVCRKTKTESIAKTGHMEVKDAAVSATCESTGKTEGSHCSICNTIIKKQETIPAIGHTWDLGKITKQATCTTDGQKTYTCTICKQTKVENIAKTGHKEVKDVAVAATCESIGKTEGSHCSVCGTVIKKQETLPALGHTWDSGKVTKAATCTTDGEKTYTCTTCHKTRIESVPKAGHTEVKDAATSATCENAGKTEGSHCSICGTVIKQQETFPALGHTWDSGKVTKAATCTEAGEKTYTCTICHKTRTESIAKTGHTEVKDTATPATCENTGKTEGSHCSICGTVIKQQEILPATGHTEITKFVKKATCEVEGYTGDIYCKKCGKMLKEGKVIEKLSHDWKQAGTKKATCTASGENTYTCTRCNKTKTEQIPATGHKWSTWWKLSDATVFKPQKQQRTCSLCHTSQTRDYGSKLKSVMRTSCSSLLLKTRQTTNVLTVSGMAKGDYVSKVISGNTGIVRVTRYTKDGKIQLTAQGRTGTTSITIQLAGGAVKRINVKVQSGTVKTTAIRVSFTKTTLKAGTKKTISTTVTPSTSQEKVTYTTSNKNIATVTANGIITARKRGTAKITVKSGNKKQIITITVK